MRRNLYNSYSDYLEEWEDEFDGSAYPEEDSDDDSYPFGSINCADDMESFGW